MGPFVARSLPHRIAICNLDAFGSPPPAFQRRTPDQLKGEMDISREDLVRRAGMSTMYHEHPYHGARNLVT